MRIIAGWVTSIVFFAFGALTPGNPQGGDQIATRELVSADRTGQIAVSTVSPFRHGDVSWLPELALAAGWPQKAIPRLTLGRFGSKKIKRSNYRSPFYKP